MEPVSRYRCWNSYCRLLQKQIWCAEETGTIKHTASMPDSLQVTRLSRLSPGMVKLVVARIFFLGTHWKNRTMLFSGDHEMYTIVIHSRCFKMFNSDSCRYDNSHTLFFLNKFSVVWRGSCPLSLKIWKKNINYTFWRKIITLLNSNATDYFQYRIGVDII